jgi:hypothetical protein
MSRHSGRRIKLPFAIAVVALVGGAAGIGVAAALRPEPVTPVKPGILVDDVGPVSAFEGSPTAGEQAVAAQPNVQRDVAAISEDTEGVPEEFLPGDRVGPVRVPLANLGVANRAIWMYRTTRGKVCYGLTDFTAGCVQQLPVGQVVNPTGGNPDDGGGTIVWGFARDNVRSIDIVVDGERQPAVVGRNTFFFQAPSTKARISAVVAMTDNGSSVTLPYEPKPTTE